MMRSSNCKLDFYRAAGRLAPTFVCMLHPFDGSYLGWCAVASSSFVDVEAATMTSQRVQRLEQAAVCLACLLAFLALHSGKGWPGR